MRRTAVLTAGCLTVALTLSGSAQQPQSGQRPVFRSSVDLVHLDVSVLDKDRHPVRGLTAADFTITEDDRPQGIVAFSAVDVPVDLPKPVPWSGRAPADVQSNDGAADPEGRLFVLLLDDALIPADPDALKNAREVAKRFIDKVTPVDRVAIVFSQTGRNQNFTNDKARLLSAIESLKAGSASHTGGWETAKDPNRGRPDDPLDAQPPGPVADPDILFRQASMQTLRQVAETLISAPQRRKALVFVSPGVAIDVAGSATPVSNIPISADFVAPIEGDPRGGNVRMSMIDANRQLAQDLTQLFRRMQKANVTICPVDPCGPAGFQKYVMQRAAMIPLLRQDNEYNRRLLVNDETGALPPPAFNFLTPAGIVPTPSSLSNYMSELSMDFLEAAASNTGGRPIINTNDFESGLNQIFDENSSYYLLGYQQPPGHLPGSQHRIKVRVNRPDVMVRTRSGYDTPALPKVKKNVVAEPLSPLDKAIINAVPDGTFPMRAAIAPFVIPGQKDPAVTIALGLAQPAVNARTIFSVEIQTNAYTADGRPKFVGQRHAAVVTVAPTGDKDAARYDLLTKISLPPGIYQLRLSANRAIENVQGSLYADVEVPDFSAPLAVSGVIVESIPTGATAPMDAFDYFLPVVPTTNREFGRTQEVTAFVRVYQGGTASAKPVEVRTRIVNELDAEVGAGKDLLHGTDFRVGGRAADYRFAIPVKQLPPGWYLLTMDFDLDGKVVQRSVQFKVKAK